MVKHTEAFLKKHKLLLEKREQDAQRRRIERERIKEEKYKAKLERKKAEYKRLKEEDKEWYLKYLKTMKDYHKKYQQKYQQKRNEEYYRMAMDALEGENFRVIYNKSNRPYYVTDKGEIFNRYGNKVGFKHPNGYSQVLISGKKCMLHRIVWEAFNGEIPEGMEVDHIIPIKNGGTDELSNLRLCTHKENCNNPYSIANYQKHNKLVDRSYLKCKKK